jgi:O-antigen ligase
MFAAGAIWAGIVLSYSRSGMAAALLASGFVLFHTTAWKRHARVLAVVLLLPTGLLLWQEIRAPGERYFEQAEMVSLAGRLPVWRASLGMVPDYPVLGTGLGTFEGAFALYRPPEVRKLWNHAHNDWLQSLTEGGVVFFVAVLALLVFALRRRGRDPATLLALVPVHAGLLAMAMQSAIDFSLRIPANAALCACLVGLTCIRDAHVDPSVARWTSRGPTSGGPTS